MKELAGFGIGNIKGQRLRVKGNLLKGQFEGEGQGVDNNLVRGQGSSEKVVYIKGGVTMGEGLWGPVINKILGSRLMEGRREGHGGAPSPDNEDSFIRYIEGQGAQCAFAVSV